MSTVDFAQQLDRQLRYIETSAREYDAGNKDEAIRVGTSLRVVFHQTGASTSLLTHLNAVGVRLLSTCDLNPPHAGFCNNVTNANSDPFKEDMWATPWLDKSKSRRFVSSQVWRSDEIMFLLGCITVSRRELSLWAANKDGGAHVDDNPPLDYDRVRRGMDFTFTLGKHDGTQVILSIRDLHLAALRQFAYETLNSPELLRLAGR